MALNIRNPTNKDDLHSAALVKKFVSKNKKRKTAAAALPRLADVLCRLPSSLQMAPEVGMTRRDTT